MRKLLLITAGIALSAVVAPIIIGSSLFEGTVVKDPYATALRWDASRDDRVRSGWSVTLLTRTIKAPSAEMIVSVHRRDGTPLNGGAVELFLTRPSTDRYDSSFRMEPAASGTYRTVVQVPVKGRWLARMNMREGDKSVLFNDAFNVE